jgi:hypothetical protein
MTQRSLKRTDGNYSQAIEISDFERSVFASQGDEMSSALSPPP